TLAAKVGQPVTITVRLTDDGVPKPRGRGQFAAGARGRARGGDAGTPENPAAAPRNPALIPPSRITVGKAVGLHLSWFVYRGAGRVTFSPDQVKPWEDTRAGANSPWAPLWTPPT